MSDSLQGASTDWVRYTAHSLEGAELLQAHFLQHRFEKHSHATFALGVTRSGVQTFNAEGTTHHSVAQNIMAFNPDVAHDGMATHSSGFGYSMVYIQPQVVSTWCSDYFSDGLSRYARQPLINDPVCAIRLQRAFEAMQQPQERLRAYNLLSQSVLSLMARHGRVGCERHLPNEVPPWVRHVQDYMQAYFGQDIRVEDLAGLAGVSRVHLNRVFTRATGTSPHAYLNSVRVHHAQQRLRAGESSSDVAVAVGFADQSHLIRRFKGALGITPRQWQKAALT